MSLESLTELEQFREFLNRQIDAGEIKLTPEEALDRWRAENLEVHPDDLAAVLASVRELKNGVKGISLEEFDQQFRQKKQLPDEA